MGIMAELEERFWSKVDWYGKGPNECWPWLASLDSGGYGKFGISGRTALSHRIAYELEVGEIPPKTDLDHTCRMPACVNPSHLEPVTHAENVRRGVGVGKSRHPGKGSWQRAKTHCPRNHEYTEENTRLEPGRRCRACDRERRKT